MSRSVYYKRTSYNEVFILVKDDVLGNILCSKDEVLLRRLSRDETVEVCFFKETLK